MFVAIERFLSSIVKEFGKHTTTVSTEMVVLGLVSPTGLQVELQVLILLNFFLNCLRIFYCKNSNNSYGFGVSNVLGII